MSVADRVAERVAEIEQGGLAPEPVVESPMSGQARFSGRADPLVVLCSNNYLGLASDPDVVAATVAAVQQYGAGSAAARFIAGTTPVHLALEAALADLVGTVEAVTFSSCSTANHAVLATLADEQTLICSDELNHASIIDGVRLARAGAKQVYPHGDLGSLRDILTTHPLRDRAVVVTDGVFSMEGDLAPLPDLVELCRRYGAFLIVDDSHATGVLGEHGRGTAEELGVVGEIDAITSTLGKALGGALGGFVAGSAELATVLRRHARPYIFSNPIPAGVAAGALRAVERLREDPALLGRLREVTARLRAGLSGTGLDVLAGESAIIPCIVGEESRARRLGDALLDQGVLVTPFAYPVVPRGTARLRVQASAALTDEDIDRAQGAFRWVSRLP